MAVNGTGAAQRHERLRAMRNYVMLRLVAAYGRMGAARFCRTFLHPARWQALRRVCFLADGGAAPSDPSRWFEAQVLLTRSC